MAENPMEYFLNSELIIHAGGVGERWFDVTQNKTCKPMTDIGKKSRPIIDWVLLPYLHAGMKKIFISLWHHSEHVIEHYKRISEQTDIKFEFLTEPKDKRLGRAGVIKHYLEKGVLDKNKPKISINGSDILKINIHEFAKFHIIGLKKGYIASIVCSPVDISQFGRIKSDPTTKAVVRFEEKPLTNLPPGEYVNTGVFYLDVEFNKLFLEISEDELPVDLEKSTILQKSLSKIRCFEHVLPLKSWLWFKNPKDYKTAKDLDIEKFLGISPIERYLGKYTPKCDPSSNNNSQS
jgi:NDP-sugar pyrophosphorylase family protein